MDNETAIVGSRIKNLRMEKFVSQTELANRIGVSQTHLSNIEHGRNAITLNNLFKIRKALGCNMSDFFVDFDNSLSMEQREISAEELQEAVKLLRMLKANK